MSDAHANRIATLVQSLNIQLDAAAGAGCHVTIYGAIAKGGDRTTRSSGRACVCRISEVRHAAAR